MTNLSELMVANGLGYSDLDPAALARAATEADEARVVRLAVTNRELRKQGLEPLLLPLPGSNAADADATTTDAEVTTPTLLMQQRLGLSAEEDATLRKLAAMAAATEDDEEEAYARVLDAYFRQARGSFGTLMGLRLSQPAYYRFQRICDAKVARRLCADPDASRQYLMRRLLGRLAIHPTTSKKKASSC